MMLGVHLLLAFFLVAFFAFLFWISRERPLTPDELENFRKEAEAYAKTEEFGRFYKEVQALAETSSKATR
jgi:hypothetical protein